MSRQSKIVYQREKEQKHKEYMAKKRIAYQNSQIKEYNVCKECELMSFLLDTLKDQSRNNIKTILSKKCVAVNGCLCSQFNYVLYRGDKVQVSKFPFTGLDIVKKQENKPKVKIDIIYEDDTFVVINKPSGLLSIESDKEKVDTAYKLVLEYLLNKDKNSRCFQVHRIDKNTSGVLLFVKDFRLKEVLRKEWNKIVSVREYIAVVDGKLDKKEDTIRSYLKETSTNLMYTSNVKGDGELAITHYKVIKENSKYSMLDVFIDSGKKNQIRVAMNDLGHTIIGDDKYGEPTNPIGRLGLHASTLEIKNPADGKVYKFSAPIPALFNKLF